MQTKKDYARCLGCVLISLLMTQVPKPKWRRSRSHTSMLQPNHCSQWTIYLQATVLLSSNKSFVESDRYTYLLTFQVLISANQWFITLLRRLVSRNASRMVHIPSFQPVSEADKRDAEENLWVARTTASSSLGQLIALGENFSAALIQECMEVVSSSMPKMGHRVHKSYASVLAFAKLVR